jgi:hypothetical protein
MRRLSREVRCWFWGSRVEWGQVSARGGVPCDERMLRVGPQRSQQLADPNRGPYVGTPRISVH